MKRLVSLRIMAVVLLGLLTPLFLVLGRAQAQTVRSGTNAVVPKGQKVDSTLFAAGSTVDIAGEVEGDVFCAGQSVTISGIVHGDVLCAGQTISITGTVDGDVRLAGQAISLDGAVAGNATVAGQSFVLGGNAEVHDLMGGTSTATINGTVKRDYGLGAESATIAGTVGRNIRGAVGDLNLTSTAKVGGNISYTSDQDASIEKGAVVAGKTTRTAPPERKSRPISILPFAGLAWVLYWFVALLLMMLVLVLLFPGVFNAATDRARNDVGKTFLAGFIGVFAAPMLIIALLVTFIGIPLAILLLALWVVVCMLATPFSAYFLGRLILQNTDYRHSVLIMLAGGATLLICYFVPIIGVVAFIAAQLFGIGVVLNELLRRTPRPEYRAK